MYRLTFAAFAILFVSTAAWPQASSSTVRGTVTDAHQAVIPNVAVTLTNNSTNVSRATVTNEAGLYVFPAAIPGNYRLTAESPGMQRFEATLEVLVQQDAAVNIVLQVGQTVTQVNVTDVTSLVRVDAPTLGHALERQRIEQLPINGRSYQSLLQSVPGIDSTGLVQAYGMRTNTSTTLFDGAPVNEVWEGWDFGRPPGLDAVEEFQVELNNSSAKFTRPATRRLHRAGSATTENGMLFTVSAFCC